MTEFFSVVLIIPAALREKANRCAVAMGHDSAPLPGATFSVPLSDDDGETITHYGTRTQARQSFLDQMEAAAEGSLPDGIVWEDFGLTADDPVAVAQATIMDVKSEAQLANYGWTYGDHFAHKIEQAGLVRVAV